MTEDEIAAALAELETLLAGAQALQATMAAQLDGVAKARSLDAYKTAETRELAGTVAGHIGAAIGATKRWHDSLAVFGAPRAGK